MTEKKPPPPSQIRVEKNDAIVTITLEGARGNALSPAFVKDLSRALYKAEQLCGPIEEPAASAIVLAGKAGIFCAGLDLKEGHGFDRPTLADWVDDFEAVFLQLFSLRIPVVAALTGPAIAGGAVLAFACDERVAPLDGRFEIGVNEVTIGLPFPSAAFEITRFAVPANQLVDVVMKGKRFDRAAALDRGLVDELASNVVAAATDRAREYAALGDRALQKTKLDLRYDALTRARARAIESRRFFVESWFDPKNVARREKVLEQLAKKA
jgi:enoyl-CoA hydratase